MYFNKTNTSVSCLKSSLCLILLLFLESNHKGVNFVLVYCKLDILSKETVKVNE